MPEEQLKQLLHDARLRLRKSLKNQLDDDVEQLIKAAICDIKRIGVADKYLTEPDALIREAILTFVDANYENNPDSEKLMRSYDMYLVKIKGGNYKK